MTDTNVQPDTPATESHDDEPNRADATSDGAPAPEADGLDAKQVPVSEAIRYRKRAQAAEQSLGELQQQVQQLTSQLDEAQQSMRHLERRQSIDSLLTESDAIDLDTARLLTERTVQAMDEPDVKLAVADLKRHKPYLFRRRATPGHGGMAPRLDDEQPPAAEQLAERAATTGDRRDLLRYLRLRRQKA
ncbi:MAG: hypothetical protein WD118_03415 [Phycisphaeraceae bacterium]